jgi:hypothetical protein
MGDSDRMRNYISDYLENSLDPSMHKEFEDVLKRSPDLRSMTDNMKTLSTRLNGLEYLKCSDDFSVKLRERIHTSSEPLISRQAMVRYSFAASFVIILVIAILIITNPSSESPGNIPNLQGSAEGSTNTINPVKNPVSGNNTSPLVNETGELDVGTKSGQNAVSDSAKALPGDKLNKPSINRVDQKKIDVQNNFYSCFVSYWDFYSSI